MPKTKNSIATGSPVLSACKTLFWRNPNTKNAKPSRGWRIARIAILAALFAANLIFVIFHEPWQDEAQAWLLVSNLDLPSIFAQLKIEGHPALWYLILFPFVKLGFPVQVMGYISLAFVTAAAWILLKKSPFPPAFQVLLLASPLFTYYLPVISRSYSVALFLFLCIAALFSQRKDHPILLGVVTALLFQTHIIFAGFALAVMVVMFIDALEEKGPVRLHLWIGLAIALCGMLATFIELSGGPSSGSLSATIVSQVTTDPLGVLYNFGHEFWDTSAVYDETSFIAKLAISVLALAMLLVPLIVHPRQGWRPFLLAFFGIGLMLAVAVFVFGTIFQRRLFFPLIFVIAAWLMLDAFTQDADATSQSSFLATRKGQLCKALMLCFVLAFTLYTIPYTFKAGLDDVRQPYSGCLDAAAFIEDNVPSGSVIVSACASGTESLIPYASDMAYWNPSVDKTFTYCDWGHTWEEVSAWNAILSYDEILSRYCAAYPDASSMYLLADSDLPAEDVPEQYLIYEQQGTVNYEECYRLYCVPLGG